MTQAIHPDPSAPVAPLAYATLATQPQRVGPRAWAGAAILAAGVALVGLGGCFLIGVMVTVKSSLGFGNSPSLGSGSPYPQPGMSGADLALVVVLYLLAFASFGGAATLLFFGTRGLLRVMRGDAAVSRLS